MHEPQPLFEVCKLPPTSLKNGIISTKPASQVYTQVGKIQISDHSQIADTKTSAIGYLGALNALINQLLAKSFSLNLLRRRSFLLRLPKKAVETNNSPSEHSIF